MINATLSTAAYIKRAACIRDAVGFRVIALGFDKSDEVI